MSAVSADPPNTRRSMSATTCWTAPSASATRRAAASSTSCRCPYRKLNANGANPSSLVIANTVAESNPPLNNTTADLPIMSTPSWYIHVQVHGLQQVHEAINYWCRSYRVARDQL